MPIAFGSGILMALATAPLNWWGLAWVAIVPLWVLGQQSQGRSALLFAFLWGVGYHGLALAWITGLHPLTWMGIPWLASVGITLSCWVAITLWGATFVVIWQWGMQRLGWGRALHRVLIGTALWCLLEWLWSLGALYWTSLSYTQSPGNLLILHLGQLSGAATVTAAIVAVNGLLAESWLTSQRAARLLCAAAIGLCLSLHGIGAVLYGRPIAQPLTEALQVGIVQGNVPTRIKLSPAGVRRAIAGYINGYEQLATQGAEAVLTPEGAVPIMWNEATKATNPVFQSVQQTGKLLWLGTFVPQNGSITQSLLTLTPAGSGSQFNKIKLVPLGEYLPFQSLIGGVIGRLSPLKWSMVPGTADQRFDTPFGRAIVSICYESAFPALFRAQAADGGQFILTASNLDPYSEVLMAQHQAQDIMRAIETDRWAARATNTGYSGIVDPHGRIHWRSQPRTYQLHLATIYRRQTQTPYVAIGDWLTPLLITAAAIASGWELRHQRDRHTERST